MMPEGRARLWIAGAALVVVGLGCDRDDPKPSPAPAAPAGPSAAAKAVASAPSGSPSAAAPMPTGRFVRTAPEEPAGVDACAYLGGMGFACVDALVSEKDPLKRRYMRRLSDAAACLERDARDKNEWGGTAHAELALECSDSGPCGKKTPENAWKDDGYACLTKAEIAANEDKDAAKARKAHARACQCDPIRAQIPVLGGLLACDGPNLPVERGKTCDLDEAKDVRACAECQAEGGAEACGKEIGRLLTSDVELADYLQKVHVPRCQKP